MPQAVVNKILRQPCAYRTFQLKFQKVHKGRVHSLRMSPSFMLGSRAPLYCQFWNSRYLFKL